MRACEGAVSKSSFRISIISADIMLTFHRFLNSFLFSQITQQTWGHNIFQHRNTLHSAQRGGGTEA